MYYFVFLYIFCIIKPPFKMKNEQVFVLLLGLMTGPFSPLFSQSAGICRDVVASSGGSKSVSGDQSMEFTIGEPIISTITGSGHTLTQGFHQPELCAETVAVNEPETVSGIIIYPNPALSQFWISTAQVPVQAGKLSLRICDAPGRMVFEQQLNAAAPLHQISCADWPSGAYFLTISGKNLPQVSKVIIVQQD